MEEKIKAIGDALASFLPAGVAVVCTVILALWPSAPVNPEGISQTLLKIVGEAVVAALGAWGLYLAIRNVIDKRAVQAARASEEWKLEVLEKRIRLGMVQIRMREAGIEDDRGADALSEIQDEIDREIEGG